jgi:uncharacterized protein YicC (UPF0701 family)
MNKRVGDLTFDGVAEAFAAHRHEAEQATRAEIVAKLRERINEIIAIRGMLGSGAAPSLTSAIAAITDITNLIESNKL